MIQANDLRIGNILQSYEGSEFEYVVIQSGDILMCQEANENFNNWRKPIPITEEWLLRLGFEKKKCGISGADMWQGMDYWSIGYMETLLRGNPKHGLKLSGYYNTNINYIHQLQNLYHALTGEELPINQQPGHSEQTHP